MTARAAVRRRGRRGAIALTALALVAAARPSPATDEAETLSVRILAPTAAEVLQGRSQIVAEVSGREPAQIESVAFFLDRAPVCEDSAFPYVCIADAGSATTARQIRVVATARDGARAEASVTTRALVSQFVERVALVELFVTALDRDNRPALDLEAGEIEVYDQGRCQELRDFGLVDKPFYIAILLDSSGSMTERGRMAAAQHAAKLFVEQALSERDQAALVEFDDAILLQQDFTGSKDRLQRAIDATRADGGTALFDAVAAAITKLAPIRGGRKAIVLLTDGVDTESRNDYDQLLGYARGADVTLYAIGLGIESQSFIGLFGPHSRGRQSAALQTARYQLDQLSRETGGTATFAADAEELAAIYARIAAELRNQYYVTFAPQADPKDRSFHKLEVKTSRPKVELRTRRGYYPDRTRP